MRYLSLMEMKPSTNDQGPVLIQGAHEPEIRILCQNLLHLEEIVIFSFKFWTGKWKIADGSFISIVISETGIGSALAAASLAIAIQSFRPVAVVNQGIAGGHSPDVNVGDIVVGEYCVNMNNFKTPFRALSEGSNSLDWKPKQNRGVGGGHEDISNLNYLDSRKIIADSELLKVCNSVANKKAWCHKVHFGGVGSSETWNSEIDRINYLRGLFGTLCEEMEAAAKAVAQVAHKCGVPFISIRVISNNITNNGGYDIGVVQKCQDFVRDVVLELST